MKTLLNMVVLFVAITNTCLGRTKGNCGARRPYNGYNQAASQFQNSFNRAGYDYRRTSTPQHAHRGRKVELVLQYESDSQEFTFQGDAAPADSAGMYDYRAAQAGMDEMQMQRPAAENRWQQAEDQMRFRTMQAEAREAENEKRMARIPAQNEARARPVQPVRLVSPISGAIAWPKLLQDERFADYRAKVGEVLQKKDHTGQVAAADQQQVDEMTGEIAEWLKADIRNVPPQDYVAARSFARRLLVELQSQPSRNDRPGAGGLVAQSKPAGE